MRDEEGMDPPALRNRPKPTPYESYFREVFDELSESRHRTKHGFPLPIPISEILSYCELYGITSLTARQRLAHFVQVQDQVYMRIKSEQLSQAQAAAARTSPKTTPK